MFSSTRSRLIGVWAAGFISTLAIVVLWHGFGLASRTHTDGYPYTQFLYGCVSWAFAAALIGLGGVLGAMFSWAWPVAGGMVTPWLVALVIELVQDPTSPNLFQFEILLYWCPGFLVAFAGASAGRALRERLAGTSGRRRAVGA